MAASRQPLDEESGEAIPTSPARRRVALIVGILMLVLILTVLIWFAVTNSETVDERGSLFGFLVSPGTLLP